MYATAARSRAGSDPVKARRHKTATLLRRARDYTLIRYDGFVLGEQGSFGPCGVIPCHVFMAASGLQGTNGSALRCDIRSNARQKKSAAVGRDSRLQSLPMRTVRVNGLGVELRALEEAAERGTIQTVVRKNSARPIPILDQAWPKLPGEQRCLCARSGYPQPCVRRLLG
jgi:hypothetical protein